MKNNIISIQKFLEKKKVNKKLVEQILKYNSERYKNDLLKTEIILELVKELQTDEVEELVNLIRKIFLVDKP